MTLMNMMDLEAAARRFDPFETPNRAQVAQTLLRLAEWANRNSDGWSYWPAPRRAAAKAMALLTVGPGETWWEVCRDDVSDRQAGDALRPVKSFLTRQGVAAADREHILSAVVVPA